MSKKITKIVLTGGPAAGKTTLISRVLHEFKQEDGWRVITIPETATELISGFGIRPFGGCMSMLAFQDFVIADQIHKEKLALEAAQVVPEDNILIIYDRALMDDKAYISDEEFAQVLSRFDGRTEAGVLAGYDAVIHLVTCAKGAEFAYNLGNAARTESLEYAREMDDRTLRAWRGHPHLQIIDNSVNFEEKINRALREIYRILGEPEPMIEKRKFLRGKFFSRMSLGCKRTKRGKGSHKTISFRGDRLEQGRLESQGQVGVEHYLRIIQADSTQPGEILITELDGCENIQHCRHSLPL